MMWAPRSVCAQVITRDTTTRRTLPGVLSLWFDAGGSRISQPATTSATALSVGGGGHLAWRFATASVDGTWLGTDDRARAHELSSTVSLIPRRWWDVRAAGSRSQFSTDVPRGTGHNTQWSVATQVRPSFAEHTVTIAGDAGRGTTTRDALSFVTNRVGVAVGMPAGPLRLGGAWHRLQTNDFPLMEAAGHTLRRDEAASAYDFDDIDISVQLPVWRFAVQGVASWRSPRSETVGRASATNLTTAIAVTQSSVLLLSAGRQLADPVRGVPQANVVSVLLRMTRDIGAQNVNAPEAVIELLPVTGAEVVLRVRARATDVVEFATSSSDWLPRVMTRGASGMPEARVPLASGAHRIAIRINGGEWRAPTGLARIEDDLGGSAGLVIVP